LIAVGSGLTVDGDRAVVEVRTVVVGRAVVGTIGQSKRSCAVKNSVQRTRICCRCSSCAFQSRTRTVVARASRTRSLSSSAGAFDAPYTDLEFGLERVLDGIEAFVQARSGQPGQP
jgi:hypothetical protein